MIAIAGLSVDDDDDKDLHCRKYKKGGVEYYEHVKTISILPNVKDQDVL